MADHALLTGLPTLAMDSYHSAIEYLEPASDFLWLAGNDYAIRCINLY